MRKFWLLLLGLGMWGLSGALSGETPTKTVKFISHRGESSIAPENTLAAFKMSQQKNSDGMECDIDITKDGVVIVAHDRNTKRLSEQDLVIRQSTWEQLQTVKITKVARGLKEFPNEGLPLFKDTLQYLGKDREYYVEFKGQNRDLIAKTHQIIQEAGIAPEQIVVIAFSQEAIKISKEVAPRVKALWLTNFKDRNAETRKKAKTPEEAAAIKPDFHPTLEEVTATLKKIHADGLDCLALPEVVTPEFVRALHQQGFLCGVWTVNDPNAARRFVQCGVDSITSDRAAMLKELYRKENWK